MSPANISFFRVSARLDYRTVVSRINEVQSLLNDQRKLHETTITVLEAELEKGRDSICLRLESIQATLHRQEGATHVTLFYAKSSLAAVKSLQQTVDHLTPAILSLQHSASRALDFRNLDPTKGLPVTLEDALGNIREIPLNWINSWEVCLTF